MDIIKHDSHNEFGTIYRIDWKDVVLILENPVVKILSWITVEIV